MGRESGKRASDGAKSEKTDPLARFEKRNESKERKSTASKISREGI
jgi:hypothetical protein